MTFDLATLDARYSTILCDIWGVLHDGVRLFDGVQHRLESWVAEGRRVILVTNAPRTAQNVQLRLDTLGLSRQCYHGVSTGGQAGIDALLALTEPVGFLGNHWDRADLERAGLVFADDGFLQIACTGLDEMREHVSDYAEELSRLAARNVVLHCLNADRVVVVDGQPEVCAGALADAYEALGGSVAWYGKPHSAIYRHALGLAGDPEAATVLAVGDGLLTDVLGAARHGLACLYVTGGISRGSDIPPEFAQTYDLGNWRVVGSVATIAL